MWVAQDENTSVHHIKKIDNETDTQNCDLHKKSLHYNIYIYIILDCMRSMFNPWTLIYIYIYILNRPKLEEQKVFKCAKTCRDAQVRQKASVLNRRTICNMIDPWTIYNICTLHRPIYNIHRPKLMQPKLI